MSKSPSPIAKFAVRLVALLLLGWSSLAVAQRLPADFKPSKDLVALSKTLQALQAGLHKNGVDTVYIGAGSVRAVLDHIYFGRKLDMRDFDVFAVRGKKVTHAWAHNLGTSLQGTELGKFSPGDLRPRRRANPALPVPQRYTYQAGYGFYWRKPNGDIVDLATYHSKKDLNLNGIFNFDRIKLPIHHATSLLDTIAKFKGKDYKEMVKAGVVLDQENGYQSWQKREPKITNWAAIEANPAFVSLRVIRTYAKLGRYKMDAATAKRLREMIQAGSDRATRAEMTRGLMRMLGDTHADRELRLAAHLKALAGFNGGLNSALERKRRKLLRHRLTSKSETKRVQGLLGLVSNTAAQSLLGDLAQNPQLLDSTFVAKQQDKVARQRSRVRRRVGRPRQVLRGRR